MFEVKIFVLLCVSLGVCLIYSHLAEARSNSNLDAWIEASQMEDGTLVVRPMCRVKDQTTVQFFLTVIKEGPAGVSLSSQSGQVSLGPESEKALCELSLGLEPKSTCRLRLEISKQGRIVIAKELMVEGRTLANPT